MFSHVNRISLFVLALIVVVDDVSSAKAQSVRRPGIRRYQSSTTEPFVSPYLRLIQPGSDPGLNYFTLVQPQLQQQQNMQTQSRQIQGLDRQLRQDEKMAANPYGPMAELPTTGGRVASRMYYSHYYPSKGTGGGGGGGSRQYKSSSSGGGGFGGMGGFGMF